MREQALLHDGANWTLRLRLLVHAAGALPDVWFLSSSSGLFKRKLSCMAASPLALLVALASLTAVFWPLCVHMNLLAQLQTGTDAAVIARRNPFLAKLDRLSPSELRFLSQRRDIFEVFGFWTTYVAPLIGSKPPVRVLEVDTNGRDLFGLQLEKGVWPANKSGCASASDSSIAIGQILAIGSLRCTVVGIVALPAGPVPSFSVLVPAQSGRPRIAANVIARIKYGSTLR